MTSTVQTSEQQIRQTCAELADISAAIALMQWDLEVMMPAGAAPRRASQLATLAGMKHERMINQLLPLLADADPSQVHDPVWQANLKVLKRDVAKAAKLPPSLVSELAETTAQAQGAWEHARAQNDFAAFAPVLDKVFALKRQEAECYGYEAHPYDALLDDYEPGATVAQLDMAFGKLLPELRTLLALAPEPPPLPQWPHALPEAAELALNWAVLDAMGYERAHGRLDRSAHPFSISFGPEDVRITSRSNGRDPLYMLYSTLHEGGHALYERGLNPHSYGLPGGEACSLSMHESQSRIWENNIGRSLHFAQWLEKRIGEHLPEAAVGLSAQHIFQYVNAIAPSFIRTEADELTYHFHVFIRYELEKQLLLGQLPTAELPSAWNELYRKHLGIVPPTDSLGCLQDVHWAHGLLGYFPTYSLGSLYAAQFYACFSAQAPDFATQIQQADFGDFRAWLSANVWQHGKLLNSEEICTRATGQGLNTAFFLDYMRRKLEILRG